MLLGVYQIFNKYKALGVGRFELCGVLVIQVSSTFRKLLGKNGRIRGEAVVTLFETKTKSQMNSTKKKVTALKFGKAVALKRYKMEL